MRTRFFPAIIGFVSLALADTTVVNTDLDYTIYLPDSWVLETVSDSQHTFYDTTFAFESQLSLVRHNRNSADYPTPEEWTRAHFIAYMLVTEYSAAPWGAVLYSDSSDTSTQGALWAPEAYAVYYSEDTLVGAWAEFVRFTASDDYGYELYALGDTADMLTNIATYAAILYGIELPGTESGLKYARPVHSRVPAVSHAEIGRTMVFDSRGRRVSKELKRAGGLSGGVYLTPLRGRIVDFK
ncbi:MAG: hypothetical protein GF418_15265 [Chitinivibrionales bacterium]|nr:hypothetical protein [Chitinivibrionales bacterium]MBD3396981.1 hypothetical protein [Chitinivibrionales bacterium]